MKKGKFNRLTVCDKNLVNKEKNLKFTPAYH